MRTNRSTLRAVSMAFAASALLAACTTGPDLRQSTPPSPATTLGAAVPSGPEVQAVPSGSEAPAVPTARPPGDDHAPLIVYRHGDAAVELFMLDAFTGERTPMGKLRRGAQVAGQSIHWSADRRSAFVFSDSDSVAARIDVSNGAVDALARLQPTPSRDAVSPAGNVVARLNDENDIDLLNLNGRRIRTLRLPDGITPMLNIVWSSDASTIAASSCLPCVGRLDGPWHVFLAPVGGGPVRQVGNVDTAYIGIDDWSTDGARLLYENPVWGDPVTGGIGVLDLAAGAATQLTTRGESAASWSPDGERIVFDSGFGGSELSVMDSSGDPASRHVIATAEPGFGFDDPVWSPNGDWILYRLIPMDGMEQTGIGDLWMVPSSGGEPRLVVERAIADW
jgi:hypothetical protein